MKARSLIRVFCIKYNIENREVLTLWNFPVFHDFEKHGLGRRLLEEMTDLGAYKLEFSETIPHYFNKVTMVWR